MMLSARTICLLFAGIVSFTAPSAAQCPNPDRLDGGPCCFQAKARLPSFPQFSQPSLDICWRDCNVDQVQNIVACWAKPMSTGMIFPGGGTTPPPCGRYTSQLKLKTTSGVVQWMGRMNLTYARTWLEVDTTGISIQVWRFLVNGDLRPTAAAGPIPCPVPPCAPAHNNRVRFTGYVDYARACGATAFQNAWMLTHACDMFDHHPLFPRAGAFHPDRSYTFVGPSAGFAIGPLQPIEAGGGPFEDVRRLNLPVPGTTLPLTCEYEEGIMFGITPQVQQCPCATGPALTQFVHSDLMLSGACGTAISTLPPGPFLPGYFSMGIGSWTIPGVYPGVERLRWNVADYDYTDPCTGVLVPEVFFGVTTFDGYPAFQVLTGVPGGPLPPHFIDQANSLRMFGGTVMNEPFFSDHILNLNF
jgi:hypothetical protein